MSDALMNHPPAVSVVVPLFNKGPYVTRCLESICRQTFGDFEVVVVDDGSTDGSGSVAEGLEDPRVRVIRQPNRGVGAARNRGISESAGALVAFLDADDEWEPGFLEAIAGLAGRYPQAGIFATGYRRCYGSRFDKETTVAARAADPARLITNYFAFVQSGDFVTSSNIAIPRKVLEQVGTFVEGLPLGEDVHLWARIALRYPIAHDARILAVYNTDSSERSFDRFHSSPPCPPLVVRLLQAALAQDDLPRAEAREIQACIDWRLVQCAYWLVDLRNRPLLDRLLREEPIGTWRYRLEASWLRLALRVLPMRAVLALKFWPLNLATRIRQRAFYRWALEPRISQWGGAVVNRMVPTGRPQTQRNKHPTDSHPVGHRSHARSS